MYNYFDKQLLPFVNTIRHLNSGKEFNDYIKNMSIIELQKYSIWDDCEDIDDLRYHYKMYLESYFKDKRQLLDTDLITFTKNDILYTITKKNSSHRDFSFHADKQSYSIRNPFVCNYIEYLIKSNKLKEYKYDTEDSDFPLTMYTSDENFKIRANQTVNGSVHSVIIYRGKECVEIKYTKSYIKKCLKEVISKEI
jgi:hypothetical protein